MTQGQVVETRVRLPRGAAIEGQVLDEHGAPAKDVWVSVAQDAAPKTRSAMRAMVAAQAQPRRVLSDEDGRFSIGGLAQEGSFRVRAAQPYGSAAESTGVRPGQAVTLRLLESAMASE